MALTADPILVSFCVKEKEIEFRQKGHENIFPHILVNTAVVRKDRQSCNSEALRDKMRVLMNTYIANRQMGEAEAVYKLFPDMHFKDSNVTTVFVPTSQKSERSKFLIRVDDKPEYFNSNKLIIDGRDGEYVEKYDIISKHERIKDQKMKKIRVSQFAKM